jgi:hypothetical protein
MAHNLRSFTRVATAIAAEVSGAGGTATGLTRDVSLNGIFLTTPTDFPAGSTVMVRLVLDDNAVITARGTVVRPGAGGWAVSFTELVDTDSYAHLRRLIEFNAPDPAQVREEFDSHVGLKRVER